MTARPRLFHLMDRAHRALFRAAERDLVPALGITPSQLGALFFIGAHDNCLAGELARGLDLNNSAVTGLAGRLEKAGLITRSPCPEDGRAQRLRLTEAGADAVKQAVPRVVAWNERVASDFTDAELETISRFLTYLCHIDETQKAPLASSTGASHE